MPFNSFCWYCKKSQCVSVSFTVTFPFLCTYFLGEAFYLVETLLSVINTERERWLQFSTCLRLPKPSHHLWMNLPNSTESSSELVVLVLKKGMGAALSYYQVQTSCFSETAVSSTPQWFSNWFSFPLADWQRKRSKALLSRCLSSLLICLLVEKKSWCM